MHYRALSNIFVIFGGSFSKLNMDRKEVNSILVVIYLDIFKSWNDNNIQGGVYLRPS